MSWGGVHNVEANGAAKSITEVYEKCRRKFVKSEIGVSWASSCWHPSFEERILSSSRQFLRCVSFFFFLYVSYPSMLKLCSVGIHQSSTVTMSISRILRKVCKNWGSLAFAFMVSLDAASCHCCSRNSWSMLHESIFEVVLVIVWPSLKIAALKAA